MIVDVLVISLMGFLNRFRGGGFGAIVLPGHPRFYVAPLVGCLALLVTPLPTAAAVGVSYLFWSLMPWGFTIGLGRFQPSREPAMVERVFLRISSPHARLLAIEAVGLLPAAILVMPFALILAPLFVAAYEAAWRLRPKAPIEAAEIVVGLLWGALIVAVA